MKHFNLIIAGLLCRGNYRTANAAAADVTGDISDIQARMAAQDEEIKALRQKLAASTGTAATAADPLGLGGMQLPKGVAEKDVLWRKQAGLNLKQAVQAALEQVRHAAKRAAQLAAAKAAKK
ncbi:MAG TPA: hypothetical protein VHY22_13445 [Chthoniobacteraceae bacterium]|jgi:hypothetical protein|nr:hypothetical protein [Chthoniobacteraceae bacterium]